MQDFFFFSQISLVYHLEIKNDFNKNIVLCEHRVILLNLDETTLSQSVIVKAKQKTMKLVSVVSNKINIILYNTNHILVLLNHDEL